MHYFCDRGVLTNPRIEQILRRYLAETYLPGHIARFCRKYDSITRSGCVGPHRLRESGIQSLPVA
jgi:hypothetical protein